MGRDLFGFGPKPIRVHRRLFQLLTLLDADFTNGWAPISQ